MTTTGPFKKRRRIVGGDLRGWDAIADALDVCRRTAMNYADPENDDPLPVKRHKGRVYAHSVDLQDWYERTSEDAA